MAETDTPAPWDVQYRLPSTVHPRHYELTLWPRVEQATFTGTLDLDLELSAPRDFLAVHARGLEVSCSALESLKTSPATPVTLRDAFLAPKNDFFVVRPQESPLPPGQYRLRLSFSGSLAHADIVGFYASQYRDPQGQLRKLVTSKFEPTYARRAFPCMDEPDKKATFSVSLVREKVNPWIALSNTNEEEVLENEPEVGLTTVKFAPSVKMSTYLACFIVCQFDFLEKQVGTLPVRTYAPPHQVEFTRFALDAAQTITQYYIDYFGIPYPMPKLDLIAIPDFVSGAMEHWGLITFRETSMIVDDSKSSSANKQRVGQVVAHELAHMWFGNLVTMKWWEDLWLNEGFASFIEYKGLDAHRPDMQVVDQFVIQDLQPVLALDSQLSSHPVIQPVAHPDQITELFDTITYSKGSAVLRMLENFLGENVFKDGVTRYLKAFEYSNAETKDLWAKLQEAATEAGQSVDVPRVMDTWTLQMGLPLVNVTLKSGKATLSQSRFLAAKPESGKKHKESPYGYRWDIPITWTFEGNLSPSEVKWLKMEDNSIEIDVDANAKWIKLNLDQMGFYRVNYEPAVWAALVQAYQTLDPALKPLDRSSLLDDAFSLAEASQLEYSTALEMADAMSGEKEYVPWSTAASRFATITPLVRGKLAYAKYRMFLQAGVTTIYNDVTWLETEGEPHVRKRLRSTVLSHACSSGLKECMDEASRQFDAWLTDPVVGAIGPDLRQLVYTSGMEQSGTEASWRKVWDRYLAEQDANERSKLLLALAAIKDAAILEMFVQLAEDEKNVRGQDYFTVLQNIADNPIGTPIVWDYVRSNWEKLVERFTLNNRYLGRMIPRITENFDTELKLKEMEQFFAEYPEAGAGASAREQALERVRNNIQWVALHYPTIAAWLEQWTPPS